MTNIIIPISDIEYDITAEDVLDEVGNPGDYSSEELYDLAIRKKIKEIKDSLPKEMTISLGLNEIDYDPNAVSEDEIEDVLGDALDEAVANHISDATNWCVNSFVIDWDNIKFERRAKNGRKQPSVD